MGDPRIVSRPHPGITPEEGHDMRARAWKFVFDAYYGSEAAAKDSGQDDAKDANKERRSA
jgi:hypothetical protein